jgi:hypothetical protein
VEPSERPAWLRHPVIVEEKLDGANVSVWWDNEHPPSPPAAGKMRWTERGSSVHCADGSALRTISWLASLLDGGWVLYGEWLWLAHTVYYNRLPDHLVVLDLWHPESGFAALSERDERARASGLVVAPCLFAGALGSVEAVLGLMGTSRFGTMPMEGVVLRRADGAASKVLRPGFVRAGRRSHRQGAQPARRRLLILTRVSVLVASQDEPVTPLRPL